MSENPNGRRRGITARWSAARAKSMVEENPGRGRRISDEAAAAMLAFEYDRMPKTAFPEPLSESRSDTTTEEYVPPGVIPEGDLGPGMQDLMDSFVPTDLQAGERVASPNASTEPVHGPVDGFAPTVIRPPRTFAPDPIREGVKLREDALSESFNLVEEDSIHDANTEDREFPEKPLDGDPTEELPLGDKLPMPGDYAVMTENPAEFGMRLESVPLDGWLTRLAMALFGIALVVAGLYGLATLI